MAWFWNMFVIKFRQLKPITGLFDRKLANLKYVLWVMLYVCYTKMKQQQPFQMNHLVDLSFNGLAKILFWERDEEKVDIWLLLHYNFQNVFINVCIIYFACEVLLERCFLIQQDAVSKLINFPSNGKGSYNYDIIIKRNNNTKHNNSPRRLKIAPFWSQHASDWNKRIVEGIM